METSPGFCGRVGVTLIWAAPGSQMQNDLLSYREKKLLPDAKRSPVIQREKIFPECLKPINSDSQSNDQVSLRRTMCNKWYPQIFLPEDKLLSVLRTCLQWVVSTWLHKRVRFLCPY